MKSLIKFIKNKLFIFSNDVLDKNDEYKKLHWIFAGLCIFGCMNFIAGYFWGQRKAVEYFIKRIEEDSFADRISYALYTMNDRESGEFEDVDSNDNENNENSENIELNDATETIETIDSYENNNDGENENELVSSDEIKKERIENNVEKNIVFARLAGFGSRKSAQKFLDKIITIDPNAHVVERISYTAKGKKIIWYQVITNEFDDKKDLDRIIKLIKQKERIGEVQIITKMNKKGLN